ncbi:hypothetical protein QN277_003945 [Acacia crassicarpa]|uniref:Uncharacterized protein n=1 Tax=Acacia crassicarpa TaxID=499986 RepID=A0AAE1J0Q8_9FABA|nr:hypothetical protein QN277_003945 [Acacia crassicarpa]
MTTHLLIMYKRALCSLRAPPSPLFDSLLFELPLAIFMIFTYYPFFFFEAEKRVFPFASRELKVLNFV